MQTLSAKELSAIEDQLMHEQGLISKFKAYADSCTDEQLKNTYCDAVTRHQKHFDSLYQALNG